MDKSIDNSLTLDFGASDTENSKNSTSLDTT